MDFPQLETDRLILREIKDNDAKDLFLNFSNPRVMQFYGSEQMTMLEEAVGLINTFRISFEETKGFRWGIQLKDNTRLIGTIGFHAWSQKNKRAEIGYELHPDYWGNGYAKEAVNTVLEYGFQEMNLNRIGAVVFLENKHSNELLARLGFKNEGILRNYIIQNGKSYDTNVYSRIR
jgi:[ribosomal protein S5]-alanine N-acetyltransferase